MIIGRGREDLGHGPLLTIENNGGEYFAKASWITARGITDGWEELRSLKKMILKKEIVSHIRAGEDIFFYMIGTLKVLSARWRFRSRLHYYIAMKSMQKRESGKERPDPGRLHESFFAFRKDGENDSVRTAVVVALYKDCRFRISGDPHIYTLEEIKERILQGKLVTDLPCEKHRVAFPGLGEADCISTGYPQDPAKSRQEFIDILEMEYGIAAGLPNRHDDAMLALDEYLSDPESEENQVRLRKAYEALPGVYAYYFEGCSGIDVGRLYPVDEEVYRRIETERKENQDGEGMDG